MPQVKTPIGMSEEEIISAAKTMAADVSFRRRLYLVSRGVPLDVALNLPDAEALAMTVVFGEHDGLRFDWETLRWID